jgi:hypothetical protein
VLQGAREFLRAQRGINLLLEGHPEFMPAARQELLYTLLVEEPGCQIGRIGTDGLTAPISADELRRVAHADIFAHCQ